MGCGFGEKESSGPRNNYTAMYSFSEGQYECRRCAFKIGYMGGIHDHLKKCLAGFLDELNTLSGVERKVVKSFGGMESDFDKMSDATEEDFCDKLIANTEAASSNLSVNLADIDLD